MKMNHENVIIHGQSTDYDDYSEKPQGNYSRKMNHENSWHWPFHLIYHPMTILHNLLLEHGETDAHALASFFLAASLNLHSKQHYISKQYSKQYYISYKGYSLHI